MANIFDLFKQIEGEKASNLPITHIIAGLGNYGREYENTRHNAGFMALDIISEKYGVNVNKSKFDSLVCDTVIEGKRVLLMKPQLYMNNSGIAIKKAADFYKIPIENVIVICDDINLDVGKMRIRRKGSDGGQKGLRSIISSFGSDSFPRIRLGVGKLPSGGDIISWVLGKLPSEQRNDFSLALSKTPDAAEQIVSGNIEKAMCEFN